MDIFPFSEKPPEPMRVDPPLPVEQELRVIVFAVTNVETIQEIDPGPGMEKLNDLLVQGHFSGDTESQVLGSIFRNFATLVPLYQTWPSGENFIKRNNY